MHLVCDDVPQVSRSRSIGFLNWYFVFKTYLPYVWYAVMAVLLAQLAHGMYKYRFDLEVRLPTLLKLPAFASQRT